MLSEEIFSLTRIEGLCPEGTLRSYLERIGHGFLTRDENKQSHICAYFLPYDIRNKKVFLIHHKKSGLWISPGGHVDKGETLLDTLNREIEEELGVNNFFKKRPDPFLLTTTPINNKVQPCKMHYDVWFLMETDEKVFRVDPAEFHDAQWMSIEAAIKKTDDPANKKALKAIQLK